MEKVRVLLADDHKVVRSGLKLLLGEVSYIDIIGEAGDGAEAFEMVMNLSPDILVTDITMPKLSGIELTQMTREKCPETKVVVLSMYDDEEYVIKAIEAGAMGYLPKYAEEDEIILAIESVAKGETYYSKTVSQIMARTLLRKRRNPFDDENKSLTDREIEVLKLIVEGLSNKLIADKLFISVRTVDTHRSNIMRKAKTKNTAELVGYAMNNKLIHINYQ